MSESRKRDADGVEELMKSCEVASESLEACLEHLKGFIEPYLKLLPRLELREHGMDFVRGLLSDLERKSTEPIAERSEKYRRSLQRFIGSSPWEHGPLLEELRGAVAREIGEAGGVIVLDPSSFPKKGTESVGVARQWCGRLGKTDNCQLGVFAGYVSNKGHTLVDERLYLPKAWAKDKARRAGCHVPRSVKFKTTHELSLEMLEGCRDRLRHGWVAGDDEFGRPAWFRRRLRTMGERYVLDIPPNTLVCEAEDPPRKKGKAGRPLKAALTSAAKWAASVEEDRWVRVTIRAGIKGPLTVWATRARMRTRAGGKRRGAVEWLLVTRTESKTPEYRYSMSNAGADVPLEEMVHAANARYWIEDCFERAKGEVGMDHYEVRSWTGWHHHITLSLLALWFLVLEQRRLNQRTPAITVQQSAEAIGELLRNPDIDVRRLAQRITRRLRRTEQARIDHWRKFDRLPPTWTIARSMHVAQ